MEIVKDESAIEAEVKTLQKSRGWLRKVIIGSVIAAGAAAILFSCYLVFNGKIDTDGLITIVIVTIFGLVLSISFMDRIGF